MAELFEIIKRQMSLKDISMAQIADNLGITERMVDYYLKGTKKPAFKNLVKLSTYLNFDLAELSEPLVPRGTAIDGDTPYTQAQKSLRKPKIDTNPYMVPFIDVSAQAGYTKAYSDIDYIHTLKHYPILPDVDPHGATWRYFQVQGDSMEPEIKDKDTILASLVHREDWADIRDYYTYVVVTEAELLIKDVLRENEQTWILLSTNAHYDPRRLDVSDVKQLWVLRRHIRNRVSKSKMYDLKEIKNKLKK